MDRSFVEAISGLSEHRRPFTHEGQVWFPGGWEKAAAYKPAALTAFTLTALKDYLETNIDDLSHGDLVVHVQGPHAVSLVSKLPSLDVDEQLRRTVYMVAACEMGPAFGQWMDPEDFIIWMLSSFDDGGAKKDVLELVSTMKSENVRENADDGYAQEVVVKSGVASVAAKKVQNPIRLQPYRTFGEISQPMSDFIIRFRSRDGQKPLIAIFESESGQWRLNAIRYIKAWLIKEIPKGVLVIA
jgi:hypothetical protein